MTTSACVQHYLATPTFNDGALLCVLHRLALLPLTSPQQPVVVLRALNVVCLLCCLDTPSFLDAVAASPATRLQLNAYVPSLFAISRGIFSSFLKKKIVSKKTTTKKLKKPIIEQMLIRRNFSSPICAEALRILEVLSDDSNFKRIVATNGRKLTLFFAFFFFYKN